MNLIEPECFKRKCLHFLGVISGNEDEEGEDVNCRAFPEGIPHEISYGSNKHLKKFPDQDNDIVFERK